MKRHAPSAVRNSDPIARGLEQELPDSGLVLEIASGSGEHALFFARRFPALTWQPSDRDGEALASIGAWREEEGPANLRAPIVIDASAPAWPVGQVSAVVCINMVHISPWRAAEGLFAGASALLGEGAPLVIYGPFLEGDVPTAPSNTAFDADLRARNPAWGLRDRARIDELAARTGFELAARHEMPANNLTLVYRRRTQ